MEMTVPKKDWTISSSTSPKTRRKLLVLTSLASRMFSMIVKEEEYFCFSHPEHGGGTRTSEKESCCAGKRDINYDFPIKYYPTITHCIS